MYIKKFNRKTEKEQVVKNLKSNLPKTQTGEKRDNSFEISITKSTENLSSLVTLKLTQLSVFGWTRT